MSLLSVEEAFERILSGVRPVGETQSLPLRGAHGRVLAVDLIARRTQPPFDASAMDGYAVRAADLPGGERTLSVIGESAAGHGFSGSLGENETVRIFTGAPLPAGADAILIQENAERIGPDKIRTSDRIEPGRHVRRAGIDFAEGAVLLPAGTHLTAGPIALAASGGHPAVEVLRRPRVAIVATGDELVLPGEAVGPHQIVASNSFGVAAMVEAAGAEAIDFGIARDDTAIIGALVDRAANEGIDILVTIGGASVGDHDLVGRVFAEKGMALDFWKVAMRPGKPLMAGRLGPMRLIGLPGNPASSMVAATLFLRPLVLAIAGRPDRPRYRSAILSVDMPENDHRADFIRAEIEKGSAGETLLRPLPRQDSSLLSIYAKANALLLRPPHAGPAKAGDECLYLPLE